jgi:Putative transposase
VSVASALGISQRVADFLERKGLLVREDESSYLTMDCQDDDAMDQLQSHSITYRIAVGPQQGRKVFTLQTIPAWEDEDDFGNYQVGKIAGFSLHAGVASKTRDRKKLERLCRYIARPAVSEERLALIFQGKVQYELKTPYRNGTTHVLFEPLDFMAKLAALVPKARANLTRYHGVLVPNSKLRAQVTPARRGKSPVKEKDQKQGEEESPEKSPEPKGHESMTWAERLKRVFNIDITVCCRCGAAVKIIGCIEDPVIITKILAHLDATSGASAPESQLPESRAPPQVGLFG